MIFSSIEDMLVENRDYIRLSRDGKTLAVRAGSDSENLAGTFFEPDFLLASPSRTLKDSRSVKAVISQLPSGKEIFVKRYNSRGLGHSIKYVFRRQRAFRSFFTALFCESRNIPAPAALAALSSRKCGIPGVSFYFSEPVSGIVETLDFFGRTIQDKVLEALYVSSLSEILARLHDNGIVHGDCKLSNFYVCRDREEFRFGVWDFDGTRTMDRPVPGRFRISELGRAAASCIELSSRFGVKRAPEDISMIFSERYNEKSSIKVDINNVLESCAGYLKRDDEK